MVGGSDEPRAKQAVDVFVFRTAERRELAKADQKRADDEPGKPAS